VRRLLTAASALVLALTFAGTAAAATGGFGPVTPRSPNAVDIDHAYYVILGIAIVVFLIVEVALVVFIIRFRSRGRPRSVEGPQITGNSRLEVIWTIIPIVLLVSVATFVFIELPAIKNVPSARAAGPHLNILVDGRQFYWRFTYPNGAVSIDRMVVPADRVVTLDVVSSDVIHSWWIPAFGGKIDAIPGVLNHTWFQVSRPGRYTGQCAELCGIQHALMRQVVDVVPPDSYARWVAAQKAKVVAHNAILGAEEFTGVCAKCHYLKTSGGKLIGPNLGGNSTLTNAAALGILLRHGQKAMPAVGRGWSDAEVQSLVDYFKQQGGQSGG
jgi:cytochrome c oxidase subunit II